MYRATMLDVVRILSVGTVVWVHVLQIIGSKYGEFFGVRGFYFVSMGGVAVTVLFVLSGLVLGLRYKDSPMPYWSFMEKRLLRLFPSYYLVLAIGVLAYFMRGRLGVGPHDALTMMDIPLSLASMYAFVGKWGGPFIGTSWFLGVIISLYALYPFLESLLDRRPHITLFMLLAVSGCSRLVLGNFDILPQRPLDWFPLCRVFEFGIGIYLAKKVPGRFWGLFNGNRFVDRATCYASELTFPLYLVHWPVVHTLKHMPVNDALWIGSFIIISLVSSAFILKIDGQVVTPFIRRSGLIRGVEGIS